MQTVASAKQSFFAAPTKRRDLLGLRQAWNRRLALLLLHEAYCGQNAAASASSILPAVFGSRTPKLHWDCNVRSQHGEFLKEPQGSILTSCPTSPGKFRSFAPAPLFPLWRELLL